eukprot:gene17415-6127_t
MALALTWCGGPAPAGAGWVDQLLRSGAWAVVEDWHIDPATRFRAFLNDQTGRGGEMTYLYLCPTPGPAVPVLGAIAGAADAAMGRGGALYGLGA